MVRFLKRGHSLERLIQGRRMFDSGRKVHSLILEATGGNGSGVDDKKLWRSHGTTSDRPVEQVGCVLDRSSDVAPKSRLSKDGGSHGQPSDMELMKERFAKLLLGEDMSGGGKGVSSALALSNAITNLAASVFGEQWRLEPMSAERKARWRREIDSLLSITDHVVEFVPSQQKSKDGISMEIMVTQQCRDLHMNIPALHKLDAPLIEYLDKFKDQNEFWYAHRDADESEKGTAKKDKLWLQYHKELVNQVLKAAMAINADVLMEMETPEAYIESLPKVGS